MEEELESIIAYTLEGFKDQFPEMVSKVKEENYLAFTLQYENKVQTYHIDFTRKNPETLGEYLILIQESVKENSYNTNEESFYT